MLGYSWHCDKGDPCQPFQYHHMVSKCMEETKTMMEQGRVLEVLKTMLLCATAIQDDQVSLNSTSHWLFYSGQALL